MSSGLLGDHLELGRSTVERQRYLRRLSGHGDRTRHDLGPRLGVGSEHAVVAEHVKARWRDLADDAGVLLSQRRQVEPIREALWRSRDKVEPKLESFLTNKMNIGELRSLVSALGLSCSGVAKKPYIDQLLAFIGSPVASNVEVENVASSSPNLKVFIVHGHDDEMRKDVMQILDKVKVKCSVLMESPLRGQTIIEALEGHIQGCTHAIVLLSPDDKGEKVNATELKHRARQNVIFEFGLAVGRLGRDNVIVLHRGSVELPSDIHGVLYIPCEKHAMHGTFVKMLNSMKAMGYKVSHDDAFGSGT